MIFFLVFVPPFCFWNMDIAWIFLWQNQVFDTEMIVDFGQSTIDDSTIKSYHGKEKSPWSPYKKPPAEAGGFVQKYERKCSINHGIWIPVWNKSAL